MLSLRSPAAWEGVSPWPLMCQSLHLLLCVLNIRQKKENSAVTSSMEHLDLPEPPLPWESPTAGWKYPEESNKPQEGTGPHAWWQCPPQPQYSGVYPQSGRSQSSPGLMQGW